MLAALVMATSVGTPAAERFSLAMRDVELSEVMQMIARQQRVNILLAGDVGGEVSFSLYDVGLDEAVESIAAAAGYAVEKRGGNYFVVERDEAGRYADGGMTVTRSYEIRYAEPGDLETTLQPYLSAYGKVSVLPDRRLLIVQDRPEFVARIEELVREVDQRPTQILIEAKILEVTLNDGDAFGVDWRKLFDSDGGSGSFGQRGLAESDAAGFFFDYATPNVEVTLDALTQRGRIRTLSTPKLLALQNQEASVVIGDRRGYQVTTTINQVTTETVEFLESGVILRVTPNVDADGRILLDIHPEVSNGTVDVNGIPSQTTTEVTTRLIVPDGQTVFIGGLIKHTLSEARDGVPVLGELPGIGRLFSSSERSNVNTETVVLITPRIVTDSTGAWNDEQQKVVDVNVEALTNEQRRVHDKVNQLFPATRVDLSGYPSLRMGAPPDAANEAGAYTLYLIHAYSEDDARVFVERHGADPGLRYYPTGLGGQYVIVYGAYATEDDAREAGRALPGRLAGLEPIVRRLASLTPEG